MPTLNGPAAIGAVARARYLQCWAVSRYHSTTLAGYRPETGEAAYVADDAKQLAARFRLGHAADRAGNQRRCRSLCGQPMLGQPAQPADARSRWLGVARPQLEICYSLPVALSTHGHATELSQRVFKLARTAHLDTLDGVP